MTKDEARRRELRCQAYNQHLEFCLAYATKECIDDAGLRWYACDAPQHDTKRGSNNVTITPFTDL